MAFLAFLTSPLGRKLIALLAVAAALGLLYHHVWHNGYEDGSADVQKEWDADRAMRLKAFSNAMEKYVTAQEEAEKNAKLLEAERQKRIDDAKLRALALPPADARLRFPASARSVLNDAASDPAKAAGPAAEPAKSPADPAEDSTVAQVTQWAVDVIGFYNECRDEVIQFQSFYHALQQAQPEVKP